MIEYAEKGAGLHAAIADAGHWLQQTVGVWISSDDAAVQALIDGYTLEQSRAYKKAEITAHAKRLRDKVVSAVSAGEMASWSIKQSEARKFAATGLTADAPLLSAEAAARGVDLLEIVSRVAGNATRFAALEAQIGGVDGRHRDALDLINDFDSIAAYDYLIYWPDVL
jgi:hypothetical protein